MWRVCSLLVAVGLSLALCGCPAESPEDDGGKKPSPAAANTGPKPPKKKTPPGGDGAAAQTGKAVAFGVGMAANRDPSVAARRAATDALEQLGVPAKGIVFCEHSPNPAKGPAGNGGEAEFSARPQPPDAEKERMVLETILEATGGVPAIGCRARAVVRDGAAPPDSVVVLAIGGDDVSCRAAKAPLTDDREAAGASLAKGLAGVENLRLVVVFADRDLAYNEKANVSANDFVGGLLGKAAEDSGRDVVLFGGLVLAGGDGGAGQGPVFLGDEPLDGHAVALGIGGPITADAAVASEFTPAEQTLTVTKSDGKWVEQLDGRPAAAVYREIRGMEPDDRFTRDWQHPIGIVAGPDDVRLRMVLDEDESRGALRFVTPIAEGTEVKVMYGGGDAGAIRESTVRAVEQSLEGAAARPLLVLLAEAAGRAARLRELQGPDRLGAEDVKIPALQQHRGTPVFGLLTNGELGPGAGFHQQSVVSVMIMEPEKAR